MSNDTKDTPPTTEQSNEEKEAEGSGGTASNATKNAEVMPFVAPASGLTLTEEVPLDGSATLEVRYL
jgi:hypothetical protein